MKTIWKYPLEPVKQQVLMIPDGGQILDVQLQNDIPQMWVLVDTSQTDCEQQIAVYATDVELPDDPGQYCATFQLYEGRLEFHVFSS